MGIGIRIRTGHGGESVSIKDVAQADPVLNSVSGEVSAGGAL